MPAEDEASSESQQKYNGEFAVGNFDVSEKVENSFV